MVVVIFINIYKSKYKKMCQGGVKAPLINILKWLLPFCVGQ